ncbi:mannose-1-phosphate guanylyltransferase/mannose-6-phosphate isomerase [Candidatus Uhrbacteria bacterium CG10_big_fil_rev_8_21_14_0_10_48_11]|uniref:Mannose-1-phosphate guanylyltransferase/mannose-6-phosphate isomerase n=1 Tax=Candidatus Uhrbacteria bacterium CG10_big_fil_rev_8_21_14_0_10_48_11 TaxID=1975037 RepID=A0A2M8LFW6_9BACT|nr:MAG: mannose-1-phosphate guanylyltransferase/mannose-6-phosphate isomerase [Candidatus Uhrbacteria bacterium CG10_big_fil_rev_8_21_14_0_10_48_11]
MNVLILAGGQGTRLWPLSRKGKPKQLQPLFSERSLLQQTVERALLFAPPEKIFIVVSNEFQLSEVRQQLPMLIPEQVLREPAPKNTAAAIAFGAATIRGQQPDQNEAIAVLAADHLIGNPELLAETLSLGELFLETHPDYLLTIGITPTYPETGYGYIEQADELAQHIFAVRAFKEKPDAKTAATYLKRGDYHWNGSIFLWKADAILRRLEAAHPAYAAIIKAIIEGDNPDTAYLDAPVLSIDYAVLEQEKLLAVIPTALDWIDIGHWQAVRDSQQKQKGDNVVTGKHVGVNTTNSLIMNTTGRLIATAGLDDLIIVDTPDALLICRADQAQEVKKIVALIEEEENQTLT